METICKALSAVFTVLACWMSFLMIFQLVIGFFGYKKHTKNYADHEPESRFLILVPAHNEAAVISGMVENLRSMDYPKELYDFYILADNCTDDTAAIARSMGANVLELKKTDPDEPTGKPVALGKALDILKGYGQKYDLVMFFDADNLIDPNMLLEVNSQYLDAGKKADLIQCYLGCKNRKGPVAGFYYMSFSITNRFMQLAKCRLGLNAGIGGTGFAVSAPYLESRGGWTAMSLTEDFELQIESTIEGRRILWNNEVRIYDEKPTSLLVSFRQNTRWAQGHWFVSFKNTKALFRALFRKKISLLEFVSTFTCMYNLTPGVILVAEAIVALLEVLSRATGIGWQYMQYIGVSKMFTLTVPSLIIFFYSFFVLYYSADWLDNRNPPRILQLPELLLSMLVNLAVASWAQVVGLIKHKKQNVWVKTEHKLQALESSELKRLPEKTR